MYTCRVWKKPETEKTVDAIEIAFAADEYAHIHLYSEPADVHLVEVKQPDGSWLLWRVQCIGPGVYVTALTDESS